MKKKLLLRFGSLIEVGNSIHWEYTSAHESDAAYSDYNRWSINSENLIAKTCDERALAMFRGLKDGSLSNEAVHFEQLSTLKALKDDYEFGMFNDGRALIEAEIFENQLDQSKELLSRKYKAAAAVIAGVVLETKLRELCEKHEIEIVLPTGRKLKASGMNDKLPQKGAYHKLWQTKILGFLHIRNAAAHSDNAVEFSHADVESMIEGIEQFLHLSLGSVD